MKEQFQLIIEKQQETLNGLKEKFLEMDASKDITEETTKVLQTMDEVYESLKGCNPPDVFFVVANLLTLITENYEVGKDKVLEFLKDFENALEKYENESN